MQSDGGFTDVYLMSEWMQCDLEKVIQSAQALTPRHIQYFLYQACLLSTLAKRSFDYAGVCVSADPPCSEVHALSKRAALRSEAAQNLPQLRL